MKSFAVLAVAALVIFSYAINIVIVGAADPDPLQDFCVADLMNPVSVNGFVCKNAMMVTANDFLKKGLDIPGNTRNDLGVNVTQVFVMQLAGLNTLGISMARIDFAPNGGLNPPHTHPRATEILTVLQGTLYVGFITTNNRLFSKTLEKGDVFVFPKGLVHFQLNVGYGSAVALAGLSSQNPGVQQIAKSLFGASNPAVDPAVLAKAFYIDPNLVKFLQKRFAATG
jgi:quercetin dioxygenase-like cupin family protein